jgi:asparagine synthetase A
MLGNVHIGEVQSSVWDSETIRVCAEKGVPLL